MGAAYGSSVGVVRSATIASFIPILGYGHHVGDSLTSVRILYAYFPEKDG
jgi:hypothetical protein